MYFTLFIEKAAIWLFCTYIETYMDTYTDTYDRAEAICAV